MSEEEQLNAAIAASLTAAKSQSPESSHMDITTDTKSKDEAPRKEKGKGKVQVEEEEEEEEIKAGSLFDSIKAVKRDETTDIANSTRIQLRLADGSRMIRRFLKTDPVRYLFEFVKAEVPDAKTQPFEVIFYLFVDLFFYILISLFFSWYSTVFNSSIFLTSQF